MGKILIALLYVSAYRDTSPQPSDESPHLGGPDEISYVKDPQKVIDFANYLYKTFQYESAITEYERALFLCRSYLPETKQVGKENQRMVDFIFLQIGRAYSLLSNYKKARQYLMGVENDTSYALIGFSFLEGRCESVTRTYEAAESAFVKIKEDAWQKKIKTHYSKLLNLPKKSPLIAGISSAIIPGTGRAYSGRLGDGVFGFLFTLGSFALAYHYYERDNYWAAGGFGGLGVFFYLGEIYGSVVAAKLYNERAFYEELEDFKRNFNYLY